MRKRPLVLLVSLFVVGLLAAGCGGGDDGDTATGEALSKAQFIKRADRICQQAFDAVEGETKEWAREHDIPTDREPSDEVKEELVTEVIVPNLEQQADDVEALGFPSGDEQRVEAVLAALRSGAREVTEKPELVIEGKHVLSEASGLAEDYGFEVCGDE